MSKKELEQPKPEKLDRKGEGRYRPTKRPAIIKDFDDEELIGGTINFPANMYEALRRQAFDRKVTMGSIIREYITKGLACMHAKTIENFEGYLKTIEGKGFSAMET